MTFSQTVFKTRMIIPKTSTRGKAAPQNRVGPNAASRLLSSLSSSPQLLCWEGTKPQYFKDHNFNPNTIKIHTRNIFPIYTRALRPQFTPSPQHRFLATSSLIEAFGHGADNHNLDNPEDKYAKYLETWSLKQLVWVKDLLWEDNPENDPRVSKITIDFMKRLEINSDRLADLQQRVEDFHSRLRNLQSNHIDKAADGQAIQDVIHVLETERKTLRNLQLMHYDTWESAKNEYRKWSPDGDEDIDNDDDCQEPILLQDPKERKARWNAMVQTATEIQARHAMTIEQMSELVIRLKVMRSDSESEWLDGGSFDNDLDDLYETVCAFMRSRMTQQLLCQHLMALGKDALGTSIAKKLEAKRKADLEAGVATGPGTDLITEGGRVVGAINVDSPVAPIVQSSMTEASQLCEATYLFAPPVSFVLVTEAIGSTSDDTGGTASTTDAIYENVSATFVRSWLQYTLIELLKNSMAATVESNPNIAKVSKEGEGQEMARQLPSVFVHVFDEEREAVDGGDVVVIKIYDQGGGIPEDFDLESLFRFAQRDTVWDRMDEQQTYNQIRSPLKGLGVGLSLSRWHMQHFGGDLTLERRPEGTIKLRSDSGRRSKWHVLGRGTTATITIPKDTEIPVVFS